MISKESSLCNLPDEMRIMSQRETVEFNELHKWTCFLNFFPVSRLPHFILCSLLLLFLKSPSTLIVVNAKKAEGDESLCLTWTVVVSDGGAGMLWSNAIWRSVRAGAYIPTWWPVIGQDHFCLHVIPPMGLQQGLMGTTVCWTWFWLFAALLVEVVLLSFLLMSS